MSGSLFVTNQSGMPWSVKNSSTMCSFGLPLRALPRHRAGNSRPGGGEEIEVVFADDAGLLGDAEAVHETTAGAHEAELAVLGKEGEVGQMVEQPVKGAVRADTADEPLAQRGRGFRAWWSAAHAADLK
jgi:hypothetical protein